MFSLFAIIALSTINAKEQKPNIPKPIDPLPTATIIPPTGITFYVDKEVASWLIACTAVVCIVIIALIIVVIVMCYKSNKGVIYANDDPTISQRDDGTVEIKSIYSIQKSERPGTTSTTQRSLPKTKTEDSSDSVELDMSESEENTGKKETQKEEKSEAEEKSESEKKESEKEEKSESEKEEKSESEKKESESEKEEKSESEKEEKSDKEDEE